ncbi:MAG: inorganic diphosphatase [Gammaproteobacteria bacterium]|nr:inorganic diphosphatase [Gammaproteobacteria bacterium]
MDPLRQLPPRDAESGRTHVLIDTPAGSAGKFKYDPNLKVFKLSRVLPAGAVFPYDFGSIPGTRAPDGDPLDVLVLNLPRTFCGCLVGVRLLGVLKASQTEKGRTVRNDRLIGAAETEVNPSPVKDLRDLDAQVLKEIGQFFENYNRAHGRRFRVTGQGGRREAERLVRSGIAAYLDGGSP